MKTKLIFSAIIGLLFISNPLTVFSQVDSTKTSTEIPEARYVRIITVSGGIFEGRVVDTDENSFLLDTELLGLMRITKMDISNISDIKFEDIGKLSTVQRSTNINPQSSRYFFAPTAIQLKKGEGYYQNTMLLYNQISYGYSDMLTVGGSLTFLGTGGTIKAGTSLSEKFHISIGGIGLIPFFSVKPFSIAFANATIGDESKNFTISFGKFFNKRSEFEYVTTQLDSFTDEFGEFHQSNPSAGLDNFHFDSDGSYHQMYLQDYSESFVKYSRNIISLGGMVEINSRTWIMTENYLVFGENSQDSNLSIITLGVRRLSKRRDWLFDYAMIAFPSEGFGGIPWLSVTIPF